MVDYVRQVFWYVERTISILILFFQSWLRPQRTLRTIRTAICTPIYQESQAVVSSLARGVVLASNGRVRRPQTAMLHIPTGTRLKHVSGTTWDGPDWPWWHQRSDISSPTVIYGSCERFPAMCNYLYREYSIDFDFLQFIVSFDEMFEKQWLKLAQSSHRSIDAECRSYNCINYQVVQKGWSKVVFYRSVYFPYLERRNYENSWRHET